jgi:hypothetical protein
MKHLRKYNESAEEFQLIDLVDYLQDLMDHYDIYLHSNGNEITMQDIIDDNEIDKVEGNLDFDRNDFQIIIPIEDFKDLEKVYYHMKSVKGHMKAHGYQLSYFEIGTDTNEGEEKLTSVNYSFYK